MTSSLEKEGLSLPPYDTIINFIKQDNTVNSASCYPLLFFYGLLSPAGKQTNCQSGFDSASAILKLFYLALILSLYVILKVIYPPKWFILKLLFCDDQFLWRLLHPLPRLQRGFCMQWSERPCLVFLSKPASEQVSWGLLERVWPNVVTWPS